MSINIVRNDCTGCGACVSLCPTKAIKMKPDEYGFMYPNVDNTLCTECKLCEKRCSANETKSTQNLIKAYYGKAFDENIVKKSSSGGIFTVLADKVLSEEGIVYGAVFDKDSNEVIYKGTDEVTLDDLRRSKYVESYTKDCYIKVKEALDNGKKVLFTGMPCHVAGLKRFLNKDYDNLITCDFICGGGASGKYFKEHLSFLENKYNSKVSNINFRPKLYGWDTHSIQIDFENGKSYKNYAYLDTYFRGFVYEQLLTRANCAKCNFRTNHSSDIILADFWGYKQVEGLKNDNKGLSLIVTNSEKGELFLKEAVKGNADIREIPLEYSSYNFKEKNLSEEKKEKREKFKSLYIKHGFEAAAKKLYMKKCFTFKIKNIIKQAKK